MPFTVITLKKVPPSLRGDLTRWMQEIETGVYVGNFNSKVREYLWNRVTDTVGSGEATICYSCRNEIGYSFHTYNSQRKVVDYDGIPLVLIPDNNQQSGNVEEIKRGFSNASKYHQAIVRAKNRNKDDLGRTKTVSVQEEIQMSDIVFLDIETTGLDDENDQIIEIGAVKKTGSEEELFHRLIRTDKHIPEVVCKLTGLTDDILKDGIDLEKSVRELADFIDGTVLIGYNIAFDIKFLNRAFMKCSLEPIHNKTIDLMREARKRNSFQENYKFETTLKEYGVKEKLLHRALEDARLMQLLFDKMGLKKGIKSL